MFVLSLVLFSAILVLIVFTYKLMKLIQSNNYDSIILFIQRYLSVIFIGVFLVYFSMIVISIISLEVSEFIFVLLIKLMIHLVFFSSIFVTSKHLINNLKANVIFDASNASYIHTIGSTFLYMSIVEIVVGFVFGVISFIAGNPTKDFMIQTNTTLILFILFGLILLLVSFILKKAIELYEENRLTI